MRHSHDTAHAGGTGDAADRMPEWIAEAATAAGRIPTGGMPYDGVKAGESFW